MGEALPVRKGENAAFPGLLLPFMGATIGGVGTDYLQGDVMRKLLVLLLAFVSGIAVAGAFPVDGGVLAVGGYVYFEKGFGTCYDFFSAAIAPRVHWFLLPRFSVGADVHFEFRKDEFDEYQNTGGYLMASYYLGRRSGTLFPFVSAGFGGGKWHVGAMDYRYMGIKIATGLTFMFNQYIGLRTLASYTVDTVRPAAGGPDLEGGRLKVGAGVVFHLY